MSSIILNIRFQIDESGRWRRAGVTAEMTGAMLDRQALHDDPGLPIGHIETLVGEIDALPSVRGTHEPTA